MNIQSTIEKMKQMIINVMTEWENGGNMKIKN
jgi:hypothetical protein